MERSPAVREEAGQRVELTVARVGGEDTALLEKGRGEVIIKGKGRQTAHVGGEDAALWGKGRGGC